MLNDTDFVKYVAENYSYLVAEAVRKLEGISVEQYLALVKKHYGDGVMGDLLTALSGDLMFTKKFVLNEHHLYGSSRLGVKTHKRVLLRKEFSISGFAEGGEYIVDEVTDSFAYVASSEYFCRVLAQKQYELTNHLGNVLATVLDRKTGVFDPWEDTLRFYEADVVSATLYYPFGQAMLSYKNVEYTFAYGLNGQEKEDEVFEGAYSAEYWMYDSRLGRRWNNDPRPNPSMSVYACFGNNPIWFTDVAGDTTVFVNTIELKKGYSEANKDKGWTEEQMNKNFDAYKNQLFKDLELMYRDNNLNVVVEETTLTFDQIKLNETDHYISFESFYSHGVRGVNFSNRSVIYYSELTEAMKNNSTLVMSNSIVHETGHGYLKAIKFNWGLDNKCLLINRDDHTVESKVGQNLMLSGSERFLSSYEKGLPKSYADLRKSKDPKYKDIKDKYLFIGFHQYYFSAYLLRYKTEPINIYKHQN